MTINKKVEKKKGVIYDIYGIYIDYLIDTNNFKALDMPENKSEK